MAFCACMPPRVAPVVDIVMALDGTSSWRLGGSRQDGRVYLLHFVPSALFSKWEDGVCF